MLYSCRMSDVHPFRRWREKVGYSADTAAAMIRAKGRQVSKRYLDAIETSQRRPSYETCEVMQSITEGAVTVAALRHWPLRVPEDRASPDGRQQRLAADRGRARARELRGCSAKGGRLMNELRDRCRR